MQRVEQSSGAQGEEAVAFSAAFKDDRRRMVGDPSGKSKRGHAEGKEKGASIHPSLRGRILGTLQCAAPRETPHVATPCALRAHAHQSAAREAARHWSTVVV